MTETLGLGRSLASEARSEPEASGGGPPRASEARSLPEASEAHEAGETVKSRAPASTVWPSETATSVTTPAIGDGISFSIFIASMITTP